MAAVAYAQADDCRPHAAIRRHSQLRGLRNRKQTLRHTFASHLAMRGVSIYKVSQWLRHKSVNTTMIYAHLDDQGQNLSGYGYDTPP